MTRREVLAEGVELYLGDCLDVLQSLGRFDALVTDPPYGVDFKGKATKHTRATREFPGGYTGGDTDIGPEVVTLCLSMCDRGVVFPGARLMFSYPQPYERSARSTARAALASDGGASPPRTRCCSTAWACRTQGRALAGSSHSIPRRPTATPVRSLSGGWSGPSTSAPSKVRASWNRSWAAARLA